MTSSPVVVITGARQTGKSTLVQHLAESISRLYDSLDDIDTLDLAGSDPDALANRTGPMCFDEVQRLPSLLLSVKRAVDRHRTAGRFILTGSSNLLLMKRVSESLAGRAACFALLRIEVKAVKKPRLDDARYLLAFCSEYGKASLPGLVIHTGNEARWLTDGVFAVPWWMVV